MNKHRELDVREILADHVAIDGVLIRALHACHNADGLKLLTRALIHVEVRQALEIDLLYDRAGNPNEAIQCEECGSWLRGEFCQCAVEVVR